MRSDELIVRKLDYKEKAVKITSAQTADLFVLHLETCDADIQLPSNYCYAMTAGLKLIRG